MTVEFRILGPLELACEGAVVRLGGRRQRGVLAILLLHANEVVSVERLADELYAGSPPPSAGGQVRDHVFQLRKLLGAGGSVLLETRSPGYVLHVEPDQLDAARFERLLDAASEDVVRQDDARAAVRLREALGLWRGPALADLADTAYAQPAIGRLEELRLTTLERRIEADLRLGQDGSLVGELETLVAEHPLREQFRAQLMLALYRAGRQAEAVGLYHEGRRTLVDELGIEPSAQLRRLAGLILRQDDSLEAPAAAAAAPEAERVPRSPYKGLRPFGEADAEDFFGRERLTSDLVARLGAERFLAVVGPSGSGKSSVVLAGLVPAVRGGAIPGSARWTIVTTTPGAYPLEELEAAMLRAADNPPPSLIEQLAADELGLLRAVKRLLPDDGSELLLIVDQLEEIFTLVTDERRRSHYLSSIERAVSDPRSRLRVVATLRADFYDRPLAYRGFGELLHDRLETVLPLTPDELERAITGPAQSVGISLEEGLLARIVADVVNEPGALPLLQYALTELYERQSEGRLTLATYHEIGGISGALAGRAERLYEGLDTSGRDTVRQLFLRLVTLGDPVDTRRRVERAELDSLDVHQTQLALAIDAFGAARLLSFDRDPRTQAPTVEIAHEALLSRWARLQDWIAAVRDDLRAHRRLSAAAGEWLASSHDPSLLMRGSQLSRFQSWAEESSIALTGLERRYLETSVAARSAEAAQEEARRAREVALERRSVNRLRGLVVVLALAALVAAGLTAFAFDQSSNSKHQTKIATARQLAAASTANLDADPELSILLALRAVETSPGGTHQPLPEAVDALHQAIATSRVVTTIRSQETTSVALSPDGTRLITAGSGTDRNAHVWDARTGRLLQVLRGAATSVHYVAYSPDGSLVAAAGEDGTTQVWSARTGQHLGVLRDPGTGGAAPTIAFSPDGARLATADAVGRIRVWDVLDRHRLIRTIRIPYALCGIAWSPDGNQVGAGECGASFTPRARAWDIRTGKRTFATAAQTDAVLAIAFSPDSRHIATGGIDGVVRIWEEATGHLVRELTGHTGAVLTLSYSPNGQTIASGSTDATARLWDAASGARLLTLHGHTAEIESISFTPAARRLATGSADGTARIWDVSAEGARDALTLVSHAPRGVSSIDYSPDGTRIIATADGRTTSASTLVWSTRTGKLLSSTPLPPDEGIPAGYSPDGRMHAHTATASSADGVLTAIAETGSNGASNGVVDLREATSGDLVAALPGGHGGVQSIEFGDRDRLAATGYGDGTAIVWDVRSGRPLHTFAAHAGLVDSVAFNQGATILATAGDDTTVKLWHLRSGRLALTLHGHTAAVTDLAFSPNGRRLATASRDGTVRVYVLPVDELMAVARSRLTRSWTTLECRQYLGSDRCPARP